jgi:hypothetical protein
MAAVADLEHRDGTVVVLVVVKANLSSDRVLQYVNDMFAEASICAAVVLVAMVNPYPDGAQQGTARILESPVHDTAAQAQTVRISQAHTEYNTELIVRYSVRASNE